MKICLIPKIPLCFILLAALEAPPLNAAAPFADIPWVLGGAAAWTEAAGTVRLTRSQSGAFVGSAWNPCPIDLTKPFDMKFILNFGNRPCGGDGLTFTLQNSGTSVLGTPVSGGLGYKGIAPSVAIEFDTYQNIGQAGCEPAYDHIAVVEGGDMEYAGPATTCLGTGSFGAAPPVPPQISTSESNVKDGAGHQVEIAWDPSALTLSVTVDGVLRAAYNKDIVDGCFSSNSMVYYGFTGSNIDAFNVQSMSQVSGEPACAGGGMVVPPVPTPVNDCGGPTALPAGGEGPAPYLFPNPASGPHAQVAYTMKEAGDVILKVYQVNGFLALKLKNHRDGAGSFRETLDLAAFAPGVYFYRVEMDYVSGAVEKSGLEKFVVTR